MIYKFIDDKGTFTVEDPQRYNLYFPLTNKDGGILSSISPNLGGDIKKDNSHFLTPPASIVDVKNNLLCRRDFFIKTNNKVVRLSNPHNDKLEAGFLYHKLTKEAGDLHIEILNFVPSSVAVEIMSIKITNRGSKNINITPTSLIPLYGRGENTLRDHRHVSSLLNRIHLNKYGIFLKPTLSFDEEGHKVNEATYFCLGFQDNQIAPLGQFPTLDYFSGIGDLFNPQSINQDIKPVKKERTEFQGKEALAAFRFKDRKLRKGESVNYFLVVGIDSDRSKNPKQKIMATFSKVNSPAKIKKVFEETKKYWRNYLSGIEFDFKDKAFNNWLLWVKLQPTLRKLFGCSFLPHFDYGKGGRGWRDLWQDALTLLINEPDKAKALLLDNFKGVRIDGSNATIIPKQGGFLSDRNKISRVWSDHGIWPLITLSLYINKTGDLGILNKNTTYFRDHLLRRAKEVDSKFHQKDFILRNKNGKIYNGSILEHLLVQHLTSFFNVGKHNIIRLENADWNDGLDMASEFGESVTFSFMYAHNLKNISRFLESLSKKVKKVFLAKELALLLDQINKPINYNNFKEKQKRLEEYFKASKNISGEKQAVRTDKLIYDLEKKSTHLCLWLNKKEWLKSGFFNGYYDNKGKRVEGRGRMNLASQVFAIMSEVATEKQIKKTWTSIKKHLYDKTLGGFRLNTNFGRSYFDLGRAYSFSYGDKENGAFFNHMVVMLANSLYRRGFIKEGSQVLGSIYKMATSSKAKIYPLIPEYFNNSGVGLYLYLTGSASWYIYTLVEEILGIRFNLGNIVLTPKLIPLDFFKNTIEAKYILSGTTIKISYIKGKSSKIKTVFLEGKKVLRLNGKYTIKRSDLIKIPKKELSIRICFE
ncbi:MAG: cellobiose phosphorylase [Candidatus Omnitrophica bacterium]|nr:cellobiose phosphorylase [Candidatus Omnitrophota bacterium]